MREAVDVLVIGAGASGGVVARRLAEAGLDVLCLEQGDWTDRADYPGASPEWEILAWRDGPVCPTCATRSATTRSTSRRPIWVS